MATFELSDNSGAKYSVDAPDADAAYSAFSSLGSTPATSAAPAEKSQPQNNYDPKGLEGSAYNQIRGWLHGFSSALGTPVDITNTVLKDIGVPVSDEPFLGSASIRHMLDVPGKVAAAGGANEALDAVFGSGTSAKYGFHGHATYADINEVPEVYRPQARAGEVMGSTIPFLAAPALLATDVPATLAAARAGGGTVAGNVARSELARAALPGFAAKAAPAAIGGAVGAYGAETIFPGSTVAQMIGQLGGGIAGAGGVVGGSGVLQTIKNRITQPFSTLSEGGAKDAIAQALDKQFQKSGEDVDQIIRNLKSTEAVSGALPAERSGSKVLAGVQQALAKKDETLANVLGANEQSYRENLTGSVKEAFAPGQQPALTAAAATRQKSFESYLDAVAGRAETKASEAANAVAPLGPAERETANLRARNVLEDALANARSKEKEIWNAVDTKANVDTDPLINAYRAVKKEMLPGARLPSDIENYLSNLSEFKQTNGNAPSQQLGIIQTLRSEALNEARKARSADDYALARRLNMIANGTPDQLTGGALGAMATGDDEKIKTAIQFSRALNEKFSQGFAGDVLGMKSTGEESIRPALTLESAATGSPQLAAQKFAEMRAATVPIGGAAAAPEAAAAQQDYLRSLSQRVVDPATGRVKINQAASFLRDYGAILDQFPEYRDTIKRAIAAQTSAEYVGDRISAAAKAVNAAAFNKVLAAGEKPFDAIRKALNGPNPAFDLKKIASLARSAGPNAVAGLRAAVLEHVMDESALKTGMSFRNAQQLLNTPIAPDQPGLLNALQREKIITPTQGDNIRTRIAQGVRHELSPVNAVRVDSVGDEAGQIARWGARILGAKLASRLGATGGGAGPSLQVAQVAASAAEKSLAGMPIDRARHVISEAMQQNDPQKLIDILERIGSVKAKRIGNQMSVVPIVRPFIPESKSRPRMLSPADITRGMQ